MAWSKLGFHTYSWFGELYSLGCNETWYFPGLWPSGFSLGIDGGGVEDVFGCYYDKAVMLLSGKTRRIIWQRGEYAGVEEYPQAMVVTLATGRRFVVVVVRTGKTGYTPRTQITAP